MVSTRYALLSGADGPGARFLATFQRKDAEEPKQREVFRNAAVCPRSATLNRMQCQAPFSSRADSRKSRPRRMLSLPAFTSASDGGGAPSGLSARSRRGRAKGRCGVVACVLRRNSSRRRAVFRLLPFRLGEFAARRKDEVRRGIGFFVHVNLMVFGHRYAEFRFDGLFGPGEKTFSKVTGPHRLAI